jgi:NADH-quinone oxidoreductase subunit E
MTTATEAPPTPATRFARVCEILDRHGRRPDRLIPILQEVQEAYRYLPREVMGFVATALGLSPAKVFGVASFYSHFALEPKGKHVIRLCDGTACHVKESLPILDAIRARLKLPDGQSTTADQQFTVELVSCLGACGLAPVVVVDEAVHGQMTPAATVALIDRIQAQDQPQQESKP